MEYLARLRCSILQSAVEVNNLAGVRTHIKILVKMGDEVVSDCSLNLIPFLRRELVMEVGDEHGNVAEIFGDFLVLSLGKEAAKVTYSDVDLGNDCYVQFTVNASPASARFFYGHMVRVSSPDVPMSDIGFGLVFQAKDSESNTEDEKPKRPSLSIVKN